MYVCGIMVNQILEKQKYMVKKGLDILFRPAETTLAKWLGAILLAVLFFVGILHWGYFLNWSNNRFDIGDWHRIVEPALLFLTKAFRSGQLPLHGSSPFLVPDRYLARVGRPLSPQTLLLHYLEPDIFVLVNVWLMYAVGFFGLLLIRRRYGLSLISFALLFLLFNFN